MCALYLCTQHRCSTVQLKCSVKPRGVIVRLQGNIAYKDNVEFTDKVVVKKG